MQNFCASKKLTDFPDFSGLFHTSHNCLGFRHGKINLICPGEDAAFQVANFFETCLLIAGLSWRNRQKFPVLFVMLAAGI